VPGRGGRIRARKRNERLTLIVLLTVNGKEKVDVDRESLNRIDNCQECLAEAHA